MATRSRWPLVKHSMSADDATKVQRGDELVERLFGDFNFMVLFFTEYGPDSKKRTMQSRRGPERLTSESPKFVHATERLTPNCHETSVFELYAPLLRSYIDRGAVGGVSREYAERLDILLRTNVLGQINEAQATAASGP